MSRLFDWSSGRISPRRGKLAFKAVTLLMLSISMCCILAAYPADVAASGAGIYWGAIMYGHAADASQFAAGGAYTKFETYARRKVSIVSWGAAWQANNTYLLFQTAYFENVRQHGAIPLLNWGSWNCCSLNEPQFTLAMVKSGKYDAFITQWAKDAKSWGHPLLLRFDWEMNGYWQFPWSTQMNGNKPADFIPMWRHVHDIFTKVGASNVSWVWCPNIVSAKTTPLSLVYPGDAYVDWICLDGYNWYNQHGLTWMSFSDVFSASYAGIVALAPSKPLLIGEFASVEAGDGGKKKAAWIADALATIPVKFPKIKALVWFNWNDNSNLTWPIESSSPSQVAFAAGISAPVYATNNFSALAGTKVIPLP